MITKLNSRLRSLIQHNFFIKVMALLVAIVLWVVVMNEQNPSIENTISVPIAVVNTPPGNKLDYDDTKAKIMVRAPRANFATYDPDDFKAYVDLSGLEEGTHPVPIQISVPQGFEFIEVQPENLSVKLDPYMEAQFPAELILSGSPAAGSTVAEVSQSSRRVSVVGPKSIVETVDRVIGYIDVTKHDESFNLQVMLAAINEDGQVITDVRVHPSTIEADVVMARGLYKKVLPIWAKYELDLPSDYEIVNTSVTPAQMEVTGDEKLLKSIREIYTTKISFANTSLTEGTLRREVSLDLPKGITAANPNVTVEIELRKKDASTPKENASPEQNQ